MSRRLVSAMAAIGIGIALIPSTSTAATTAPMGAPRSAAAAADISGLTAIDMCPATNDGRWHCHMKVLGRDGKVQRFAQQNGYGPTELWSAYKLDPSRGQGHTIGVIEAGGDSHAEADLAVYRTNYGLAPCSTANGCFRAIGQSGGPPPADDPTGGGETMLDLDMVSATCPNCHILLVSGNTLSPQDLNAAVDEAVLQHVDEITISLGSSAENFPQDLVDNRHYNHPGIFISVASGDCGFGRQNGEGLSFPATSPYVTAVGGTRLVQAANARGWDETVWKAFDSACLSTGGYQGPGSGCSSFQPKPQWQVDPNCSHRTVADVAADADPATGVAVYDTLQSGGWVRAGGTSAAAPIVAGGQALAGGQGYGTGAGGLYMQRAGFDVTVGNNWSSSDCGSYLCDAGVGYDGPTGIGGYDGALAMPEAPPPQGYWLVARDGGIFPFGNAVGYGSTGGMTLNQPIVGISRTPDGGGYWLVAADGGIFPFGNAGGYGSTGGIHLNKPIVGMAGTQSGKGYWLVAADGGIFPFGDAVGYGSTGGTVLNQPIVGMAAVPNGQGYWLVARDGGIFPFGPNAGGYGSTGGQHLNQPIVGMSAARDGQGYWLVARDGGIFPFGPGAGGYGSTGGQHLNQPIVGMAATLSGRGYWLVAGDGGIFPFGDAIGLGSTGGQTLNQPVVAMDTATGT